jgi:hypothetical protein
MAIKDVMDLDRAMAELAKARPIFHSEADFQFALAAVLRHLWPEFEVRLEVPQSRGITLDILVIDPASDDRFAIELKYKSANWSGAVASETFNLKNHGADDLGGYDIIKDIGRIESLIASGLVMGGAVIVLTNEQLYWKPRPARTRLTNAHEFRVHDGLTLNGSRSWGPNTGGTNKKRTESINLDGSYPCEWKSYSDVGSIHGIFRQLTFYVGQSPPSNSETVVDRKEGTDDSVAL